MTTVGYCSQLSSQIQQRRHIIFLRHVGWPGKEKEKALKALHVPVNMLQSFCIHQSVISPVAAGTLLLLVLIPFFFSKHLHILPALLSLEPLPSAHLATVL